MTIPPEKMQAFGRQTQVYALPLGGNCCISGETSNQATAVGYGRVNKTCVAEILGVDDTGAKRCRRFMFGKRQCLRANAKIDGARNLCLQRNALTRSKCRRASFDLHRKEIHWR